MCLGFPGEVLSVNGRTAIIDCWGTQKRVTLDSFDETLLPGDFVIEHDGTVVRRIPADDVEDTISMYETVLCETFVPA